MTDPIQALAKRAEDEPFFLASVLAIYAQSERLDEGGLAAALGCPVGELTMIRLCRTPQSDSPQFWEDITTLADRFGMNPTRLAEAVKRGRVLLRLRAAKAGGALMAARDHEILPPEEEP
jgi:hypothetical protein